MQRLVRSSLLIALSFTLTSFIFSLNGTSAAASYATAAQVQDAMRIPMNSKVYIAPMDNFEGYLAAAFRKKNVPLILVANREDADFEITGSSETKKASKTKMIFLGDIRGSASATMQIVNLKTGVVAYADSSNRSSANRGQQSTAEKLAKYLKKKMEKDAKSQ